eukprot:CAMPEP_0176022524 /NCGR_PEP_ID=MMETSP0120_2-20121206/10966_1 /TAXON_ID=160619 /ORGANISM="Kryptoperidinium foliaceum, Strain CCMP 1326" /LENGTH=121 /DNA_ID=CAMNT_0017355665 /DNA_START=40 /DNA_END=403 /DNA_ORIENTATION=+
MSPFTMWRLAVCAVVVRTCFTSAASPGSGLLLGYRGCMRKCTAKVNKEWDYQCEHLRDRLEKVTGHDADAVRNALGICKQSKQHQVDSSSGNATSSSSSDGALWELAWGSRQRRRRFGAVR